MELYIDTTEYGRLRFELGNAKLDKRVDGLSESLLPELKRFLRKSKIKLSDLKKITVNPGPGGFSSTRTGVATANALNFALGLSEKVVLPKYGKGPNIQKNPNLRMYPNAPNIRGIRMN